MATRVEPTTKRHLYLTSPPRVQVSNRCLHGCYSIAISVPALWHLGDDEPLEANADEAFVMHAHTTDDDEWVELCDCWEDDDEP